MFRKLLKAFAIGFVLLIGLGVVGMIFGTSVEPDKPAPPKEEAISPPKEAPVSKEVEPKAEPAPAPKKEAPALKEVTLGSGTFYVGEDIPAGRYAVSTQEPSGNFLVTGDLLSMTNEILGTDTSIAVNNVTVDLKDGEQMEISGLNAVKFTPKK